MAARETRGALPDEVVERHARVLRLFVEVYCVAHHVRPAGRPLCDECQGLVDYGRRKLERCPYDPKPKCKECPTHCYGRAQRARVREVMRYSGMRFVTRGRLDWLVGYFLGESLPGPLGRAASALPHAVERLLDRAARSRR